MMTRIAGEREMNLDRSAPWSDDVARAVKVYQARRAYLVSRPLLALLANTAAFLPRCSAADDNDKQQGFVPSYAG